MTGPCSGTGVGVQKAGLSALQYVGPAAIGGALAGLSGWQGAAVGAAIGTVTYELATFCPDGPPAWPTFTVTDIAALLSGPLNADYFTARQKLQDFLGNIFWPLLCECSSGTFSPGTPSAYPADAPQTTLVLPALAPCMTIKVPLQSCPQTNAATTWFTHGSLTTTKDTVPLPAGASYMTLKCHVQLGGGAHASMAVGAICQNISNVNQSTRIDSSVAIPPDFEASIAIPSGMYGVAIFADASTVPNTDQFSMELDVWCGGQPGQSLSSCCAPDAGTQAQLDAILRMVTLIQRQAAPFSYVYGANHTGLTNTGAIAVADLIGVSVDPTTIPASYGREAGTPTEYFGLGFVTLGTADGYSQSRRIDHDGTLFIPPSAGVYTTIGYTLAPGVVADIRELVREP